MKKVFISLMFIGIVGIVSLAATRAFFSDTETSTGNTLVAGAIDLKIDSQCTYNGADSTQCGEWDAKDLTSEKFFNFTDLKPGDQGENTISLDLSSNPAYACVIIENMHDDDLGLTEPESEDGDKTDGADNGELSKALHFFTWGESDCDNVWENGELSLFSNVEGPASDILDGKSYNLNKLEPGKSCIGVYWCYGKLTVGADNALTCDGSEVNNVTQTDKLTADIRFYVEQFRNNEQFVCPSAANTNPRRLVLENEDMTTQPNWTPKTGDEKDGLLTWQGDGPTFDFTLTAQGLPFNTAYSLIYYADPFPGNNPGGLIWSGNTDSAGAINASGNPNLGFDIPTAPDTNIGLHSGGKVWLIPSANYNSGTKSVTPWAPTDNWLFEGNVYINYNDTDN